MTTPESPTGEPPETSDDDIAAFAEEYDDYRARVVALEEKMSGLDEISAKLDALLKGNVGGVRASKQSTTSGSGASSRTRAPQGEPQQTQGQSGTDFSSTEKKPKSEHWYFRDAPWKRG